MGMSGARTEMREHSVTQRTGMIHASLTRRISILVYLFTCH
jgi:hypothetical protein